LYLRDATAKFMHRAALTFSSPTTTA